MDHSSESRESQYNQKIMFFSLILVVVVVVVVFVVVVVVHLRLEKLQSLHSPLALHYNAAATESAGKEL